MTIPNWGRVTPSQMFMLMLAGHVMRGFFVQPGTVEPEKERLKSMAMGRASLRRLTGQDFGYDLKRWNDYLLATKDSGYRHPYAWRIVRPAIAKALEDQDRLVVVEKLEQERERLSSEGLAVLVIDALVDAGLLKKDEFRRAVDVASEEIEVRKAMGDY